MPFLCSLHRLLTPRSGRKERRGGGGRKSPSGSSCQPKPPAPVSNRVFGNIWETGSAGAKFAAAVLFLYTHPPFEIRRCARVWPVARSAALLRGAWVTSRALEGGFRGTKAPVPGELADVTVSGGGGERKKRAALKLSWASTRFSSIISDSANTHTHTSLPHNFKHTHVHVFSIFVAALCWHKKARLRSSM